MFYVGNPEATADVFFDLAKSLTGPQLPDLHIEEYNHQQLRHLLVYARMAYNAAEMEHAPQEVLDVLMGRHDAVWGYLMEHDDKFRARVTGPNSNNIQWLGGFSEENIKKYKTMGSAN